MGNSMVHLNGNLLCAVDTETTGLRPFYHDICEICILPLDATVNILSNITPFYCQIIPRHMDRIDESAMSVNKQQMSDIMRYGLDSFKAADLFEEWYNKLGLGIRKKISPLAQNWKFDWAFISDWLGVQNMDFFFDGRYRDPMSSALFLNDYSEFHLERVPFPKVNLTYLCSQLKVNRDRSHEAMQDCIATAEVYRRMLKDVIVHLPMEKVTDDESLSNWTK